MSDITTCRNRAGESTPDVQDDIALDPGRPCCGNDHFVQFYERDEVLVKSLAEFCADGLNAGDAVVVIASPEHRQALEERLTSSGIDLQVLKAKGAHVSLDADGTLSQFMDGDAPDERRFLETIEPVITRGGTGGRKVRAFGEMVALLWLEGKQEAAIRLEELWNKLGREHDFTLFCAYPMRCFSGASNEKSLLEVCRTHSRVIPAESYSDEMTAQERAVAISVLQQKAAALEAEAAERQSVERSLREKEEALSELEGFAYSISHDLRAPLRSMRSFAEILIDDHGANVPGEALDYMKRITEAAERMDRVIHDVLNYSRLAESSFPLEPVDLNLLIEDLIESSPHLQAPAATITVKALPVVLGNPVGLTQCFSNLLGNAAKFVAPGKHPTIKVWSRPTEKPAGGADAETGAASERWVRVLIHDNGIGLPAGAEEKVFHLFGRGAEEYEGSGVGLAIVRKAAERMGGYAGYERNGGDGSTFWLELKAAPK